MCIDGNLVGNESIIADHVMKYYEELYKCGTSVGNDLIQSTVPSVVSSQQNSVLCSVPKEGEIKAVVFSMNVSSAPGLDGFKISFYKVCLDIINNNIVAYVQYFFLHGDMSDNFNLIHFFLVPKSEMAHVVQKFRPIVFGKCALQNYSKNYG